MSGFVRILCGLVIAVTASAEGIKDEPADFRGVSWGQAFESVRQQMTIARDEGDVKYYRRDGDNLKLGQVDVLKVAYRFYKDAFCSGILQTYGGANQKDLLATLTSMHGTPQRPRKRIPQYFWDGNNVFVVLTCEVTSYCVVEISSKQVIHREQAETGLTVPSQQDHRDN